MIIGLSGFAGVGKDTVADILVRDHGFVKMAIADPLKRVARDIFDFDNGQLWGPSSMREALDQRYPRLHTWHRLGSRHVCACCRVTVESLENDAPGCCLTPRYVLQLLGTEFGRHCYDSIWIEKALTVARTIIQTNAGYSAAGGVINGANRAWYEPLRMPTRGVVLSDVRFLNELRGIQLFNKRHDELVQKSIETWHNLPETDPRELHEFLGMDPEEYAHFIETKVHPLSAFNVRVTRPGFEKPRYDHQSETEQTQFKDSDFAYVFTGGETLDGIEEKVADMIGYLNKDK